MKALMNRSSLLGTILFITAALFSSAAYAQPVLEINVVDTPDPVVAGEFLTYEIAMANSGDAVAEDTVVVDELPPGTAFDSHNFPFPCAVDTPAPGFVTCGVGDIGPGLYGPYDIVVKVDPGVAAGTLLVNTAEAESVQVDSAPVQVDTLVVPLLELEVVDTPDPVGAGQRLTYSITVKNNSSSETNITKFDAQLDPGATYFSDTLLPAGSCIHPFDFVICELGTVAAGDSRSFDIVVDVADMPAGTITTKVAAVSEQGNALPHDDIETTVVRSADLFIFKEAYASQVTAGENLKYKISVINLGILDAAEVKVTDTLPAGFTYVSDTLLPAGSCNAAGQDITCLLGTVDNGVTAEFDIVVAISSNHTDNELIKNTAVVSSTTPDVNPDNNTSSAFVRVVRRSELAITKTDSPDPVIAGTNLTYGITVHNAGPSDAADTTVIDVLPPGTTYVSTPGCTPDTPVAGEVTCTLSIVEAKSSFTFDLVVHVAPTVVHGTTITNTAVVSSDSDERDTSDNTASEDTVVNRSATFDITKIWDRGEVDVTLTCSDGAVYTDTTSGKTAQLTHTAFADGVDCVVTETVPAGFAPAYSAECNVDPVVSGSTYSCTFTNTPLIPTLSQYGLALLALLMLGVGFVGFRRFV